MAATAVELVGERALRRVSGLSYEGRRVYAVHGAADEVAALNATGLPARQSEWDHSGGTLNYCRALRFSIAPGDEGEWVRVIVEYGPGSIRDWGPEPYAGLRWHEFSLRSGSQISRAGFVSADWSGDPERCGVDGVPVEVTSLSLILYTYSNDPLSPAVWVPRLNTLNAAEIEFPRHINSPTGSEFDAHQCLYRGVLSQRRMQGASLIETVQEWGVAETWTVSGYHENENGEPTVKWPASGIGLHVYREANHAALLGD